MTARSKTPLRREFMGDRAGDKAQDNALMAHRTLNGTPFTPRDGVLISNVAIASGASIKVTHGLGRPITGCFPTLVTKAPWAAYVTGSDNFTATLFQAPVGDVTANLWFF